MQIQFNTDESVDGHEALGRHAESVTRTALQRFGDQLTRVEIHLHDVNGAKSTSDDKHCLIEARLAGRRPIAVRERADSLHQALDGATRKLVRRLDSTMGRQISKRRTGKDGKGGAADLQNADDGDELAAND
jgi:ribosome-associated translation inhibitor RaiA